MKTRKVLMDRVSMESHYTGYPLLNLQNKTGTLGRILKNTFYPPYKKPLLPFGGKSATVHSLLRSLKIAHTLLVTEHVQLGENIPAGYQISRVLYSVDALYDHLRTPFEIGKECIADQVYQPYLVQGFEMSDVNSQYFCYSFDLTPFYTECLEDPDHSVIDVSEIFIEPLKTAAAFYNECVELLFEKGFFVFPLFYVDAMAGLYPPETIEGAIVVEI